MSLYDRFRGHDDHLSECYQKFRGVKGLFEDGPRIVVTIRSVLGADGRYCPGHACDPVCIPLDK